MDTSSVQPSPTSTDDPHHHHHDDDNNINDITNDDTTNIKQKSNTVTDINLEQANKNEMIVQEGIDKLMRKDGLLLFFFIFYNLMTR